jgi:predicted ATPase
MVTLTHIRLQNWRNFTDVQVELTPRQFLVGPNASGKSNFLDAFRFLHDLARPGGGLVNACAVRRGVSKIRALTARAPSGVSLAVDVKVGADTWRYEIAFSQENKKANPILVYERVEREGEVILNRPDEADKKDLLCLTQTALEQIHLNQDFRVLSEAFSLIQYLHLVPQLVRDPLLATYGQASAMYGGQLLEDILKTHKKSRSARLNRILEALKIAVPQLESLEVERDDKGQAHLMTRYRHGRHRPAKQDESQLSDGTLRLFALLWAVMDGEGPIGRARTVSACRGVRHIPAMLVRLQKTRRQLLISTHSYELLSDTGIGGEEVLIFEPSPEGTRVYAADSVEQIRVLLETGLSAAEVIIPQTTPQAFNQLSLLL